jgi:biotin carboxyl carrier protein
LPQENVEIPIAGKVVNVNIKVGDKVKEGDTLCLLESMKMEIPILAPLGGTITQLGVSAEHAVKPGDLVAIIEYSEAGD